MSNPGTYFKPGNPGKPPGVRNKRTQEIIDKIKELGHRDPLETLSELQHNAKDEAVRATAANMLAPYIHSRMGLTPQPAPPRYIEEALSLPKPTNVRIACENIALLSDMKATGKLDIATADSLIADQRVILEALIEECKLLANAQDPNAVQSITIKGGLPQLHDFPAIRPFSPVIYYRPHPCAPCCNGHDHNTMHRQRLGN
jgi:hypothetical protein